MFIVYTLQLITRQRHLSESEEPSGCMDAHKLIDRFEAGAQRFHSQASPQAINYEWQQVGLFKLPET